MKKNSFKTNISEIKKVSKRIPKTINEAINFNEIENDEFDDEIEDEYDEEPSVEKTVEQPVKNEDGLNAETFINDTRKKSLQIMAKLADEPESKTYEIAKRIWQICDKCLNDDKIDNENPQKQFK